MSQAEVAKISKPIERFWIRTWSKWSRGSVVNFEMFHDYHNQFELPKTHLQFDPHCNWPSEYQLGGIIQELLPQEWQDDEKVNQNVITASPDASLLDQVELYYDVRAVPTPHLITRGRELCDFIIEFGYGTAILDRLKSNRVDFSSGEMSDMLFCMLKWGSKYGDKDEVFSAITVFRQALAWRQLKSARPDRPLYSPKFNAESSVIPFAAIFRDWNIIRKHFPDAIGNYVVPLVSFGNNVPLGPRVVNNRVLSGDSAVSEHNKALHSENCICQRLDCPPCPFRTGAGGDA